MLKQKPGGRPSIIEGTVVEVIRLSDIKPVPGCPVDPKGSRSDTLHTSKITIVWREASKLKEVKSLIPILSLSITATYMRRHSALEKMFLKGGPY
jgi:hypothetical protein